VKYDQLSRKVGYEVVFSVNPLWAIYVIFLAAFQNYWNKSKAYIIVCIEKYWPKLPDIINLAFRQIDKLFW
jgi:hypothetical protein